MRVSFGTATSIMSFWSTSLYLLGRPEVEDPKSLILLFSATDVGLWSHMLFVALI